MSDKKEQSSETEKGGVVEMVQGYQQAPPQAPQNHDAYMYASPQAATGYAGISKEEVAAMIEEEGKKRWMGMNPSKGEEHDEEEHSCEDSAEMTSKAAQGAAYMGQPMQPPMQQPAQGAAYMGQPMQPPMQQPAQGAAYMGQPMQPPMQRPAQGAAYMGQPMQPPMQQPVQGAAYMGQPMQPPMQQSVQGAAYMGQSMQPPMQQPVQGAAYMGQPMQPLMPRPVFVAPPMQPMFAPTMAPPAQEEHSCGCGGGKEDAGIFGMIKQMVDNNPQLSSLTQYANATNSELIKGVLLGAGIALLLSNTAVKESLGGMVSGLFGGKEQSQGPVETLQASEEAAEPVKATPARSRAKKESEEEQ